MKISIVIPTFNEKENISTLIPQIFKVFEKNNLEGEVIVVDDNSSDGTAKEAENLSKKFDVKLISRNGKFGLGSAYLAGFNDAISRKRNIILSMDADHSHDPKKITALVKLIIEGNDISIGSRYIKGGGVKNWPFFRIMTSSIANLLAGVLLGTNVRDNTSGYRAYKREVLESIDFSKIHSNGYSFLEELIFRAKEKGFKKIAETPIIFVDRRFGKSKLSSIEIFKFFKTVLVLFFERFFKLN